MNQLVVQALALAAASFVVAAASVLAHEIGHAVAGKRGGAQVDSIRVVRSLSFVRYVTPAISGIPIEPRGWFLSSADFADHPQPPALTFHEMPRRERLVAILAGPAVNAGIALTLVAVTALLGRGVDLSALLHSDTRPAEFMLAVAVALNAGVAILNLVLPFGPTDGARLVRTLRNRPL